MNYIRMTRGAAHIPASFWDRILVTKQEVEAREKLGYVISSCKMYDYQFELEPTDKIVN